MPKFHQLYHFYLVQATCLPLLKHCNQFALIFYSSAPLCSLSLCIGWDMLELPGFLTWPVSTAFFLLSDHISFFLLGSFLCSLPTIPRAHLAISRTHYECLDSRSFLLACSSAWILYLQIHTWIAYIPFGLYFICNLITVANPRCFL